MRLGESPGESELLSLVLVIYELGRIMDMGFVYAGTWATIYQGGPYNVTTSVNVLIKAVALGKSPRLININ